MIGACEINGLVFLEVNLRMRIKIVGNSDFLSFVEHTEIYFLLVFMLIFYFRQSLLVKQSGLV